MEEEKRIKEILNEGVKVFDWARWVSTGIGVWPLALNNYLFNIAFLYFTIVMIFEYIDLYIYIYDLKAVMENLSENIAFTIVYMYTFLIRVNIEKFAKIFKQVLMDYNSASAFKNLEEVKVFMMYTNNAKIFTKSIIISIAMSEFLWYIQPLTTSTKSNNSANALAIDNEMATFSLPYHIYVFYEINSLKNYVISYVSLSLFAVINALGIMSLNIFLIILVFHVSGRLAVLAIRIDDLQKNISKPRDEFVEIITEHIKVLKLGNDIADVFSTPLLVYFLLTNLLLCILGYEILLNIMSGLNSDIMQFIVLLSTVYLMLFVICMNSENLASESNNVCRAFYNCNWHNLPKNNVKDIIYCLVRSQKPIFLKAGKFSTFSYSTFADGNKVSQAFYNCSGYNLPKDCVKNITYCLVRSQKPIAIKAGKFSTFSYGTLTDMKELLNEGVKVFDWARWISVGIGVWPLTLNNYIFNIAFFYSTVVLIFEFIDLFVHIYDFAAVVDNLSESLAITIDYSYTFSLRFYNKKLAQVLKEALMDYNSASAFKNLKEVEVFITYTNTAKFFAKYIIIFIALTEIVWLVQPLLTFFMFDSTISSDNETTSFILPYRFHVFYEINDIPMYLLTYFWQAPNAAVNGFGISSINVFLLILVFHVSGRLAILALRIDEFEFKKINPRDELVGIIVEHIKIMKLGDEVSDIFATPLLIFFVLTNLLLCISLYQILLNFVTGLNSEVFQYIILVITVYLMLYVICMNGELLLLEGNKVSQAFYNCSGYDLPIDCVKNIIHCLVRSQKPIAIKAGKFSTFSYGTLTDITKTAMGYLSILRKLLMNQ
ncbi:uncharacterized protein LOC130673251 [Microplitis mediator]|uniref:uncharacterized protein LOC130673251 n=1 Tax=Microplitis mediator TaxID=375433 RepID=UPI002552F4DA|nr:uncharacterized protein LOC130673251 [Microplitis mediator]